MTDHARLVFACRCGAVLAQPCPTVGDIPCAAGDAPPVFAGQAPAPEIPRSETRSDRRAPLAPVRPRSHRKGRRDMTDDELQQAAVDIANEIGRVCEGKPTVAVYAALAMMLGGAAAQAEQPDFHGMIRLVKEQAWRTFLRRREGQRNG